MTITDITLEEARRKLEEENVRCLRELETEFNALMEKHGAVMRLRSVITDDGRIVAQAYFELRD